MKTKIDNVNKAIANKRDALKKDTEKYFSEINVHQNTDVRPSGNRETKKPPISYILYGIAGISAIGAVVSDSKIICLGVAALSVFGGYRLSKLRNTKKIKVPTNTNISTIKNDVAAKILETVRKVTQSWENFSESAQKDVQDAIMQSVLSNSMKEELSSKTFIYEVIDINISDFTALLNSADNIKEIEQGLFLYKQKLLSALDLAANKQIAKYKSIVDQL